MRNLTDLVPNGFINQLMFLLFAELPKASCTARFCEDCGKTPEKCNNYFISESDLYALCKDGAFNFKWHLIKRAKQDNEITKGF